MPQGASRFRRALGGERRKMVLLSIYEVAEGTTEMVAYEDIVVAAWKLFPQEFGLRGYTEKYPDSWNLRRPLYGPLEREGYIRVQRNRLALTDSGLATAERLRAPNHAICSGGTLGS
jgi:hypothetical protein